uniref:hypothetical protein n=1 Tax=Sphingobium sp. TaxID=1912891 RepID=UPI0035C70F8B
MIDRRAVLAASLAAAFAGRSREALAAAVSPDDGAIELHGRRLEIVRAKRELDRDAQVGPEDLAAWEKKQGGLPAGCCVAMLSGWDPLAEVARYGSLSPEER